MAARCHKPDHQRFARPVRVCRCLPNVSLRSILKNARVQENAVLSHSRLNVCSGKFGNIVPRSRHSALPPKCGATGQAPRLRLLKKRWARLPPTPRSADRARSLALVSKKREYFNVGRRLSAISLPSCSNWEYRDGQPIHKNPQLAGTYRIRWPTISS